MTPVEVFDTERQKQLRKQAIHDAAVERKRQELLREATLAQWRRLLGKTIVGVASMGHDTLRLTLSDGLYFFIEPSEWADHTITETASKDGETWEPLT